VHRFEVEAGPGQERVLEASQSRVASTQLALTSFDLEQMIRYNRNGSVSDAVLAAFRGYAERRAAVDSLETRIAELDAETGRVSQDQQRIRQLMSPLSRQDALHARYLRTLEEHEDRLEAIRAERAEVMQELERRRDELNSYVRELSVE
jgi:chromosome segregation ATPase